MNLFQVIALIVVALLLAITVTAIVRGRATRREGAVWLLVWLAAGVAFAWPAITTKVANLLGIRRGADLVLYCAVVVMLVGFLMVYIRMRRLQRELTLIVRHMAVRDARLMSAKEDQEDPSTPRPQPEADESAQ